MAATHLSFYRTRKFRERISYEVARPSFDVFYTKIEYDQRRDHLKSIIIEGAWSNSLTHPENSTYDTSRKDEDA